MRLEASRLCAAPALSSAEAQDFAASILCTGEGEEDGLIVRVGAGQRFGNCHRFVETAQRAGLVAEILFVWVGLKVGEANKRVDQADLRNGVGPMVMGHAIEVLENPRDQHLLHAGGAW